MRGSGMEDVIFNGSGNRPQRNMAEVTVYLDNTSRGAPAGAYTVNLHLYRNLTGSLPIPVQVAVSLKPKPDASARAILSKQVTLRREGEELTVFRFALAEDGELLGGSVHDLPRALRSRR